MVNHDEITDMSKHPGKAVKLSKIMWTDDMIETLITSYQPYDAMWNMTIPDFKNQNKKLYIWKKSMRLWKNMAYHGRSTQPNGVLGSSKMPLNFHPFHARRR